MADLTKFFEAAGGSPEALCGALSETVASLLLRDVHLPGSPTRVGRPVSVEIEWVALITGYSRPAVGDLVALFLRSKNQWRIVAVTEVLGGCPGRWRVRKRFLARTPVGVHHDAHNRRVTSLHPHASKSHAWPVALRKPGRLAWSGVLVYASRRRGTMSGRGRGRRPRDA